MGGLFYFYEAGKVVYTEKLPLNNKIYDILVKIINIIFISGIQENHHTPVLKYSI